MMSINNTKTLLKTLFESSTGRSLNILRIMSIAVTYARLISENTENKGKVWTARRFKEYYLFMRNIAMDLPLPSPLPFVRTDKQGIPLAIKPMLPLLKGTNMDRRIGLTIGRFYESITHQPIQDTTPITEKYSGQKMANLVKGFRSFLEAKLHRLSGNVTLRPYKIVNRLVSGPNGPAMLTAHYDALAIIKGGLLHIFERLAELDKNFLWVLAMLKENAAAIKDSVKVNGKRLHTGKLSFISEPGGKTRTIAIVDYWSQIALRPIHDLIMNILKRMETDGTWDQDSQSERIKRNAKGKIYSYDLSSATDRFPRALQVVLLAVLIGDEYAVWWESIMTARPFFDGTSYIMWEVGQPLGALSSWPVFALTHHMFIEYCAHLEGINSFREYAVLGDDVVIWNEKVALRYETLMTMIGVTINHQKSIVSGTRHQMEFAKRLFLDGEEITGLKYTIINEASRNIKLLPNLLKLCQLRSWPLDPGQFSLEYLRSDKLRKYAFVLLTITGFLVRPVTGVTLVESGILEIKTLVLRLRINRLIVHRDNIWNFLSGNIPIKEHFDAVGVEICQTQIDYQGNLSSLHPIVFEVNHRGEQVIESLELLDSLDMIKEADAPVLPVEYIPLLDNSVYFGDKHKLISIYKSSLIIEAYKQLASPVKDSPTPDSHYCDKGSD